MLFCLAARDVAREEPWLLPAKKGDSPAPRRVTGRARIDELGLLICSLPREGGRWIEDLDTTRMVAGAYLLPLVWKEAATGVLVSKSVEGELRSVDRAGGRRSAKRISVFSVSALIALGGRNVVVLNAFFGDDGTVCQVRSESTDCHCPCPG